METVEMDLEFIVCEEDEAQTESRPSLTSATLSTGLDAPVASQIEETEAVTQPASSTREGKYQRPDVTLCYRPDYLAINRGVSDRISEQRGWQRKRGQIKW